MNTILKVYEDTNLRVGKTTIVRIALYSRLFGSNLNVTTDKGDVHTWLLADAPDALRNYIASTAPTSERSL